MGGSYYDKKGCVIMTSKMLAFVAVVASAVASMMSFADDMRVRYALTFQDTECIAQFVPGNSYCTEGGNGYIYKDIDENVGGVDVPAFSNVVAKATEEMLPYAEIYRKTFYGKVGTGNGVRIALMNLNSDVKYKLRLHTIEFYSAGVNKRTFALYVNGDFHKASDSNDYFDVYRDVKGRHIPYYYDVTNCCAAADGTMSLFLSNVVDKLVICGIELFEPTNAPCYKPNLQVKGYQEFACIIPESQCHRSSTVLYDIEYRDGGEESEVKTLSSVWGGFVYDTTPAEDGVVREYRVRIAQEGNENWSDWVSAGDRSVSALTDSEGQTLLPLPAAEYENMGVVSVFHKNASDSDASAGDEESVTDTVTKNVLNWTQADVPESCTGEGAPARILTSGKIWFPYMTDGCKIVVKGSGLVNLWMDDGWMKASLVNGGVVTNEFMYFKYKGDVKGGAVETNQYFGVARVYDFYVEQLQGEGSDIATSIEFIDNDGNAIPVKLFSSDFTADISPWKFHQLHKRNDHYKADVYAVPLDEDKTSFRIYGCGYDTWGGKDGGSLMYQRLKGSFEITMRIKSRSDVYDTSCRLGFSMRGGLGTSSADKFLIVACCHPGASNSRPMVFWDKNLSDGMSIGTNFAGEWNKPPFPVWLKLVNTTGVDENKNRVFNFEYYMSSDGESWDRISTGSVPRSESVYVGPIMVNSTRLGAMSTWMEIDNLELIDNSVLPMMIIIR